MRIDPAITAHTPKFTALRRQIHAEPELGFEEERTSALIVETLTSLGIPVVRGIGGTGVVGTIAKGSSSRAIGLRADMDALPIIEDNSFAHASRHAGRMHACGHDGHVAMLLAAAKHLAEAAEFDGVVHLVFQPAEERGAGARRMIEDGLFTRFPMEAIFGAHNWPGLPVGAFAVAPGPMMASCNEFSVRVTGKGGHAALPDQCIDPIQPACAIALALQSIVSRNLPPSEAAVLSVTKIAAGDAFHIIPNAATLQGTVRTYSSQTTAFMERRIREIAAGVCAAYGASCEVDFVVKCAPTVNHAAEAEFVRASLVELAGAVAVQVFTPSATAEDFSFMLEAKAGCYFMIGAGDVSKRGEGQGEGPCVLHNPSYDFNDDLIPIGAQAWSHLATRWLAQERALSKKGRRREANN